jgi:polyisoprenoid-binding protein YceI
MKNILLFAFIIVFSVAAADAQTKFTADNTKSTLNWLGEKVTGQHNGTVNLQSGWLIMEGNKITGGEFLIDMASLKDADKNERLEGHLKSDDFFGVAKFPTAKLVLKSSESFDKGSALVKGDLTIKDSTNPVEFKALAQKKEDGSWFFANIVLDRTKFNIRYGSGSFIDNLGDRAIYDEFKVKVALLVK